MIVSTMCGEGMTDKIQSDLHEKLEVAPFVAMLRGVQHGEV